MDPIGRNWMRFPSTPLSFATTYQVSATVRTAGRLIDKSWVFTTGEAPQVKAATAVAVSGSVRLEWVQPEPGVMGIVVQRSHMDAVARRGVMDVQYSLPPTATFFLDGKPPVDASAVFWCVKTYGPGGPNQPDMCPGQFPQALANAQPEWHSQWVRQSPYPVMSPGEVREFWVEFVNLGNQPWTRGGWSTEAHLALNGDDHRPAREWGMNPGSWLSADRLASHDQAIVQPGEVGRFRFSIRAPTAPGVYDLNLRPVVDGVTWMEDNGVYWHVTVAQPYHSKWVDQSAYPSLSVGQSSNVTVRFRNVGTTSWAKGTASEARLGLNLDDLTAARLGMAVNWLADSRPARQIEDVVAPGALATFSFQIKGTAVGTYALHLRPVVDGVTWMEDEGVFMQLVVR